MFTRYKIIRSFKELKQLVEACLKTGYASVDFETNGKGIYTDEFKPTILSVTFQVGSGCSIPLQHFDESLEWMQDGVWLDWLLYFGRNVIENPKVVKIAWNWKFDNQIFQKYHIYSRGTVIDGMLAKYLLNEERPNGLKDMVRRYLPEFADYEKYDKFETISWDKKPLEPLCKYGCMDTDFTFRLAMFLEKKLIDKGFYNLYRNLIMPASKVLQEAESNGLPFDIELNSELTEKYATLIKEVTSNLRNLKVIRRYEKKLLSDRISNYIDKLNEEISQLSDDPSKARSIKTREAKISRVLAGEYVTNDEKKLVEPVNFNSQKQMVDLLYNSEKGFKFPILEYTRDAKTKNPSDNPSTSSDTLEKLIPDDKTGFIKNLLDLRGLDKMNSTYILGLRELVQSDNRVHPTFLIHGTVSGRLSSRNPNGQNIPKVMVNPDIKRQFITPPGKLFLTYDYSQAELRILAHLAKEDTMLEWFRTGKDIHLASACKKYHEDYDKIIKIYEDEQHPEYPLWKKRRKQAKCYSPDTEILTPSGWQRLDSYDGKSLVAQYNFDTEEIEFVKPENYGKVISENNYIYKDRNISLDITDEHKTLFITRAGKKVKDDFKNLVGKSGYMPVAGYIKKEYPISDDMTRFIAMFISDGNYSGLGLIRFGFKKPRKIKRCKEILNKLGVIYTNPREGKFYLPLKGNEWVYNTLAKVSDNKALKWDILNQCNGDIYLQEAGNWDGHINFYNQVTFSTTIKITADIMQAMGHLNGYMVSLRRQHYKDRGIRYVLGYSLRKKNKARVNLNNAKPYTVAGGKEMWSVTVPSRNLVVRKDNKVVLSGNTINFGIVYEQSAKKLAESLSTPDEKVSEEEGQVFLDEYFETFPKIKRFMDRQHKFMEKHGYCESLFGRRRRCPKVYSDNYSEYLEALRQCVDEETEALTTDGWRRYDQLYNGQLILTKNCNTGILEWQPIENINIYPDYQGDLYSFEGKTFSALTNGKHRWLCNHDSKPGSKAEFLTTEELYNSKIVRPIHRTGEYNGNRKKVLDDDLVYLLGIILTDGHLRYYRDKTKPRYGKPWYALITQSKEKNIPLIQSAIDKLDNRFTYIHKVYGKKHVWKFNKDFADYLDTIIPNKKLNMSLIHSLTKSQIRLLLDGMILGDGCKHGTRILTSSIEQANLIQVLVVMAGYYSNILINDNRGIHISNKIKHGKIITKNISYLVTIGESKYFHHRSTRGINHIKKLSNQKQLIWCPTVKNGTWVCRRKGKTYITGNSTNMPCQSAASDMALFASIIVYEKVKKGELPPMQEVNTVHDSVYQFIEPRYITPDTIFGIWDICRNPSTKKYFGFEIKDVDMSMDFTVGRTMAEELPYIPGYDYNKMLSPNFDINEYYEEHRKVKGIQIVDYPKEFKEYFRESWRKR